MKDFYETFAYDYDEFGQIESHSGDERTFFKELFAEHDVKKILDCACGTGQHLHMFTDLGYDTVGSDYSEAMLDVAKMNLEKHKMDVPLKQCDFRFLETAYEEKFDAVVCMNNSLPHLLEDKDLVCALISMKKRLNSGGLLVLSSGTTEATLKLPSVEVVVNRRDFSRIFVKKYDGRLHTINIVDLIHNEERAETHQYEVVYRVLFEEDYRRLLADAGFEKIEVYGSYDRTHHVKDSWKIIVVAKQTTGI